jgi:hypothetical protein
MAQPNRPSLIISLDFELFWGVRDKRTIGNYGRNILGVREALPAMLALFRDYGIRATWATVGLLLFDLDLTGANAFEPSVVDGHG